MSYSDIISATQLYSNLLNKNFANTANNLSNVKLDYAPVNPQSSSAYTPRGARNIYTGYGRDIANPVNEAANPDLTFTESALLRGTQGLSYGSLGTKLSPILDKGLGKLNLSQYTGGQNYLLEDGTRTFIETGGTIPEGATASSLNLGPAATVYGLTRNQNPYDYTQTESLGTTASTMMAANQLAMAAGINPGTSAILGMNPYVAIGSYLLSRFFNKKGKKAAERKKQAVYDDIKEQQDEIYTDRETAVKEGREDMLAQQTTQMYEDRAGQYSNQYGGNYRMEDGGKMDIVAEFTGNELVLNSQADLEKALKKKDYKTAASYIRDGMNKGNVTPGPETHKGNPMPVDSEGNIYAGGGALPFKAQKGAGIYDHATDQFKRSMSDKEISMVAQKNINKWKSNNMYS